jgi:uncharacterized protein YkwD
MTDTLGRTARQWMGTVVVVGVLAFAGAACTAAAPPPSGSCYMDPFSSSLFNLLNADRAANGLPGLAANGQLTCLAQNWSQTMASTNTLGHQNLSAILSSPSYSPYFTTLGEILAEDPAQVSATDVNTAWMNSPEHRANILSPSFRWVGVGVANAYGSVWATADFGG